MRPIRARSAGAIFGLTLCVVIAGSGCDTKSGIDIRDAWVRTPAPGQDRAAGYFRLHYPRHMPPARITGASSAQFAAVEMHTTTRQDGVARMRPLAYVELRPGTDVEFGPGASHLMLLEPARSLHTLDAVSITLHFDDLEPLSFSAVLSPVEPAESQ